jgi:hypothetical protein
MMQQSSTVRGDGILGYLRSEMLPPGKIYRTPLLLFPGERRHNPQSASYMPKDLPTGLQEDRVFTSLRMSKSSASFAMKGDLVMPGAARNGSTQILPLIIRLYSQASRPQETSIS